MSRHRAIRNLDLDEEMADDYDEEPWAQATDTELEQLESALTSVKAVVGAQAATDDEIRTLLWESYFDVEGSVQAVLEEAERRGARERKKAEKQAQAAAARSSSASKPASGASTPARGTSKTRAAGGAASSGGAALDLRKAAAGGAADAASMQRLGSDVGSMSLSGPPSVAGSDAGSAKGGSTPGTPMTVSHERVIEEWRKREESGRRGISLVVVGHVDAGKSTLMGRLLHELGTLSDKEHTSNERASAKIGKGSFAYAWALDSSEEERERGVTIDVAQDTFLTPNRRFTLLDAPGHRDFIPNMISGAAQADAAVLVVDASKGGFESGFGERGQTREHAILVRSLGVQQLVVAVNKMDAVDYDEERFKFIVDAVKPFLAQSGFDAAKVTYVPVGAAVGENLVERTADGPLASWYTGPSLVAVLDELAPPSRQIDAPLRMPVTNVFRGQTAISAGVGASGRVVGGLLSVGDRVHIVPGDESAVIRALEQDGETVPWAVAGSAITAYLSGIEMNIVNIGSVLCPPSAPVQLATSLLVRVLVFEPSLPLMVGTPIELFHHSSNLSAVLTELVSTIDPKTGEVLKRKPRVLSRGVTATVRITLQAPGPIEPASVNKDMGRVILRMRGESVAAGVVLECN